jgi:hypothetical protein
MSNLINYFTIKPLKNVISLSYRSIRKHIGSQQISTKCPIFQCLYPYVFDSDGTIKHLEKMYLFTMHPDEIPQNAKEKEYLIADFIYGKNRCKVLYPFNDTLNPERVTDNLMKTKVSEKGNGIVRPGSQRMQPRNFL